MELGNMPEIAFSLAGKRIWVAGHTGLVGGALVRRLAAEPCTILTVARAELDLTRQADVESWVGDKRPDAIVVAAARVGGILANASYPVAFLCDNLLIETNIVKAAHEAGVNRLLLLGSSCIYPRMAPQPIHEDALLTGPLESSNEWYAIAKIAGLKLCQAYRREFGRDYISAMPTNLYGIGDHFDLEQAHVIPALMMKMHRAKVEGAKSVPIWGTGSVRREFLYVDDCADALVGLLQRYSGDQHINVGTGEDLTILQLAELMARIVGFEGELAFDPTKPDGTPRKVLDVSRLAAMGWRARTSLADGLRLTYKWYSRAAL
jgi:GDP-L-fucose synthase